MEAKQTEIERLIYDSKEYLKRNHFGEYTLLYILNKDRVKGSPYQYAAVASTDEARLFFNVYAKEDQPDICWEPGNILDAVNIRGNFSIPCGKK